MIYSLIRWLTGYIIIEVLGDNISRFFNICAARDIEFENISKKEGNDAGTIYITMWAKDFFKLHDVVVKCHIKVKIVSKKGLPFITKKYKKQKMMFAGIGCSFILMYCLSLFVWQITVEGNYSHSDEEIIDFLEDNHIYHGINKKKVESYELEKNIRNNFDDITWVSVELTGTRLIVHIKENFNVEKDNQNLKIKDLLSPYDGIIYSLVTRSGTPAVKEGAMVKKGDVLIRAAYDILNDAKEVVATKEVAADGTIYMYVIYDYYDELKTSINRKKEAEC